MHTFYIFLTFFHLCVSVWNTFYLIPLFFCSLYTSFFPFSLLLIPLFFWLFPSHFVLIFIDRIKFWLAAVFLWTWRSLLMAIPPCLWHCYRRKTGLFSRQNLNARVPAQMRKNRRKVITGTFLSSVRVASTFCRRPVCFGVFSTLIELCCVQCTWTWNCIYLKAFAEKY